MVIDKALRIMEQPICDHCLGRQFAQLVSGLSNDERGRAIRTVAAMAIDREDFSGQIDLSNFAGLALHRLERDIPKKPQRCAICNGLFEKIETLARRAIAAAEKHDFRTFLVGTKLPYELVEREEQLWERVGIDGVEPLKAELNREIGRRVERAIGVKFDPKNPDITVMLNLAANRISIAINPLYLYGEYQKLVRGIPQTRWPSRKYKTSVEQIIAKPFMAASKGLFHKFHGLGREDIDARCLGWRPFVLEIANPTKRALDFKKLGTRIAKQVKVRKLRPSSNAEVRRIKEMRADKTYRATVTCDAPIARSDLKKLAALREVRQRTPHRVAHRRADLHRMRKVRKLTAVLKSKKSFVLTIRGEAGLYIKELISGDEGRTEPSVSKILGVPCHCKELDVIKIHV